MSGGLLIYVLTMTFAAFDWGMSLEPHWFSTIFGVYYFAASVVGFMAVMPKILYGLQMRGILKNAVTVEHYHDIGKLLLGRNLGAELVTEMVPSADTNCQVMADMVPLPSPDASLGISKYHFDFRT